MADEQGRLHSCSCPSCSRDADPQLARYHVGINSVLPVMQERSRRLFAGLLASEHGRGGVTLLCQITGLSRTTILRGQRELAAGVSLDSPRIRRPGGGRPRTEKKLQTS